MENQCFTKVIKLNPNLVVNRLIIRPENAKQDPVNKKLLDQLNRLSIENLKSRYNQENELMWRYIRFFQSKDLDEVNTKYGSEILEIMRFEHNKLTTRLELVSHTLKVVSLSNDMFGYLMGKGLIKEYKLFIAKVN